MNNIVYIAGPITGRDNYVEYFKKAQLLLEEAGFEVINPAPLHQVLHKSATHQDYMDICMMLVRKADTIYLLDGWSTSPGAKRELAHFLNAGKEILVEV